MGSACCKSADDDLRKTSFNEVSGTREDEEEERLRTHRSEASSKRHKKNKAKRPKSLDEARSKHLEDMMLVLFNLHDLNSNGFLEEDELVQLNTKVAMLHHGKDTDLSAVKAKYRALFREKLDPEGQPVLYAVFRKYVIQVLDGLDPDPLAQEMIVEQFAAEARSARAVFHVDSFQSQSDQLYLSKLTIPSFASVQEEPPTIAATASQTPASPSCAGGRPGGPEPAPHAGGNPAAPGPDLVPYTGGNPAAPCPDVVPYVAGNPAVPGPDLVPFVGGHPAGLPVVPIGQLLPLAAPTAKPAMIITPAKVPLAPAARMPARFGGA